MESLRLIFEYRGTAVELRARERVEMISPPSDAFVRDDGESGFWYELRDADERPLYRQIMMDPLQPAMEVLLDDSGERAFSWQPRARPEGIFVTLMPQLEEAHSVVLYRSPTEEPGAPAVELARFLVAEER
jgi:hypothetical protein